MNQLKFRKDSIGDIKIYKNGEKVGYIYNNRGWYHLHNNQGDHLRGSIDLDYIKAEAKTLLKTRVENLTILLENKIKDLNSWVEYGLNLFKGEEPNIIKGKIKGINSDINIILDQIKGVNTDERVAK